MSWQKGFKNRGEVLEKVWVNAKNHHVKPGKNESKNLKTPGCYFTYKKSYDWRIGTDRNLNNCYVLAFGNRDASKSDDYGNNPAYEFQFIHPVSIPLH